MTALATADDVTALLGRDLTDAESDRVEVLLAAASARFRTEARREFTAAEHTVVLRVDGGRVTLPQRPVSSVDTVHAIGADGQAGAAIGTWVFDGIATIDLGDWTVQQVNAPELDDPDDTVQVTWTAGYATVPEDVRWTVAGMALRTLTAASTAGVESETIGGYTYRLGAAAAAGPLGMTPDELAVARRYRPAGIRSVPVR